MDTKEDQIPRTIPPINDDSCNVLKIEINGNYKLLTGARLGSEHWQFDKERAL
jgi:hypothetical protein